MPVNKLQTSSSPNIVKQTEHPRLMLFDLSVGGHHPSYFLYLIQHWCERQHVGQLDIIVSPAFLEKHADVVQTAEDYQCSNVRFVAIEPAEAARLKGHNSAISKAILAFKEWRLFCKYARLRQADQALLMYFDTAQVPFVFGPKPPCPVSGIYFRPTFHYSSFGQHPFRLKDRIQVLRERFNLSQLLNRAQMGKLFCLDPFVDNYINKQWGVDKAIRLADPVKVYDDDPTALTQLSASHNIQPDRTVFLMFGALTRRKGLDQVLDAIALLPANLCEKICLLMVGSLGSGPADKDRLKSRISTLTESTAAQAIVCDDFIPDEAVQSYFQIADFVLATYQKHVGMSGILNRAALAQKPVISSNYGLMGEVTRQFGLGLAVDSTNSTEIAQALTRCVTESADKLGDPIKMKQFGEQNLAERFASVIFQHLLNS